MELNDSIINCLRFANPAEANWRLEARKLDDSSGQIQGNCLRFANPAEAIGGLEAPRLGGLEA